MGYNDVRDEGRSTKRCRVLWAASLLTQEGEVYVRVRDLSDSGAQIACNRELQLGTDVIFRHCGAFTAATVVWSADGEAGLRFYRDAPALAQG